MLQNFLTCASAEQLISDSDNLAVFRFNAHESADLLVPSIRIAQLSDKKSLEVWRLVGAEVERGLNGNCCWGRSENLQIVTIEHPLADTDDLAKVSEDIYHELLSFVQQSAHPELIRFWNYVPDINGGAGDEENYKQFCTGRLAAFNQREMQDLQFPAASAVGHHTNGITVSALTSNLKPTYHTNPRQVDAFKYPRQYGSSSPSFARASTLDMADQRMCFISGTASILGHNSVHQGDLKLQLYTTSDNILYLLEETGFSPDSLETLRIYLRNPNDFQTCQTIIEKLFPNTQTIYAHADICRSELLVEIECYCVSQRAQ